MSKRAKASELIPYDTPIPYVSPNGQPGRPLPRFIRSHIVLCAPEGRAILLALSEEIDAALTEEARRQGMSMRDLIIDALRFVAMKGLEPLLAAPDREPGSA